MIVEGMVVERVEVVEGGGFGAFVVEEPDEAGGFVVDEPFMDLGVAGANFFGDSVEGNGSGFVGGFVLEGMEVFVAVGAEFGEFGVAAEVGEPVELGFEGVNVLNGREGGFSGHGGFCKFLGKGGYILLNFVH